MLIAIKLFHTIVWAGFVACILGVFAAASFGRFGLATFFIGVVMVEVVVLLVNKMRCPLTGVAARYTAERADNFDIYLPLVIARDNKTIFGALCVAGIAYTFLAWLLQRPAA